MTITILDTNETTQQSVADGDTLIVTEGTILATPGAAIGAFSVDEFNVTNAGLITGETSDTILITPDNVVAGNFGVDNLSTGYIIGASTAIFLQLDDALPEDDIVRVTNEGTITANLYTAIYVLNSESTTITNSGMIQAYAEGGGFAYESAITLDDTVEGTITNTGSIISGSLRAAASRNAAISIVNTDLGSEYEVYNSGLIQGEGYSLYSDSEEFVLNNSGTMRGSVQTNGLNSTVANSGSIAGDVELTAVTSIDFDNSAEGEISGDLTIVSDTVDINSAGRIHGDITVSLGTSVSILNSGEIDGNIGVYDVISGPVTFLNTNTGFISGDIIFDGFPNPFDVAFENNGMIDGDILFGDGDDTYFSENGGTTYGSEIRTGGGDDVVIGGEGRDRVYDGGGDDDVSGNGGNDSFRAGGGANFYDGGDGYDYLSYYDFSTRVRIDLEAESTSGGGGGNAASNDRFINIEAVGGTNGGGDTLLGDSGRNSLFGWGGDDKLYGRGGNDKLDGGAGDDFFDGGGGTDLLIGGLGEDRFHFDRGEGDDTIADFENNVDQLEFDNFSYLSTAADALTYATQVGNDVYFDFGADGTVLVLGVTVGQLANDIEIV